MTFHHHPLIPSVEPSLSLKSSIPNRTALPSFLPRCFPSPDNDLFSILTTDRRYSANCRLPKLLMWPNFGKVTEVTASSSEQRVSRDYGAATD